VQTHLQVSLAPLCPCDESMERTAQPNSDDETGGSQRTQNRLEVQQPGPRDGRRLPGDPVRRSPSGSASFHASHLPPTLDLHARGHRICSGLSPDPAGLERHPEGLGLHDRRQAGLPEEPDSILVSSERRLFVPQHIHAHGEK